MSLLLALAKPKDVDVSAHIDIATQWLWIAIALLLAFFVLRPELWRRLWFQRIDPRGPALARMALGITLVWTFVDLLVLDGEWLFTDQGMLLTDMARKNYGGKMRTLWDPEHGFQHWYDPLIMLTDRWSVLFMRSDPPFVYGVFGLLFVFGTMMTIGLFTRFSTFMSWLLMLQLYNYNPIYYTGGDTVMRVMMFLAIFIDWGQVYSVDAWRRRRKAILSGAERIPAPRRIAAWPIRLLMIQLACIYCATGLLKSGKTWANGTALYYALNLDHFYRIPAFTLYAWADQLYITRVMTVVVHWWEVLFPLVFLGEILRGVDDDQKRGTWVGPVPRWTFYALGLVGSILVVWSAPTGSRLFPLFVLAALIYIDRRWLHEPDTSGKGLIPWTIRVLSWSCLMGFVVIAALFASLGVHYYYNPPPEGGPAWLMDKEQLRTIAMVATISVPLSVALVIVILRRYTPRIYVFVRDWLLGKRLWLTIGVMMHIGIDLTMNVGTFVQVMIAVYPVWLGGNDVEAFWRYLMWRPAKPGEAGRPPLPASKVRRVGRKLIAVFERAKYRVRRPAWVVVHGPSEIAVRRAALLRCWDVGSRLEFELDAAKGEVLVLRSPDSKITHVGARAGRELVSLLPGLWWLWPISMFPGVGRLATMILRQRVG